MAIVRMTGLALRGKRVLIREDLNVPINNGRVTSDTRIRACLPTVERALRERATVRLISHLGRPTEGVADEKLSLRPVAERLSELLGQPVPLIRNWTGSVDLSDANVALYENVRFIVGETSNDDDLAKKLAAWCDVFVMDAFATAHRAQASTHGVAKFAPVACAGPLLCSELDALGRALEDPARPLVAIVGGAKVSTKLTVLESLCSKVDQLIPGGGIANTFLAARGHSTGRSLIEPDLLETAQRLTDLAHNSNREIPVPTDVVVGHDFAQDAEAVIKHISDVAENDMIMDIGPETTRTFVRVLERAGTIVWNGPVGVFEWDQFGQGTKTIASAVAESSAFSIAGGGDTLAAAEKYNVADRISYISTGGGAFLEFLEGKKLPAVEILEQRGSEYGT